MDLWRRRALWLWPLVLVVLALVLQLPLISNLDLSNRYPTFWRSVNLRSGVSPLLPQVILMFGLYGWFWYNLKGLSLFGEDRPVLPCKEELPEIDVPQDPKCEGIAETRGKIPSFGMFSRQDAGNPIEEAARPLTRGYLKSLVAFLIVTVAACWLAFGDCRLRTPGDRRFGALIFFAVCLCIAMILADALQFLQTWSRLRKLLVFLDRLRLRRTLEALKGLSWDSVWGMSGNVLEHRYCLISRQFESMRNFKNTLEAWTASDAETGGKDAMRLQLEKCERQGICFAVWYLNLCEPRKVPVAFDMAPIEKFQKELATTAACAMKEILRPAWNKETQSLMLKAVSSGDATQGEDDKKSSTDQSDDVIKPHVRAAEEFFVLPYLGFIQNTIGRIRSIATSILALLVAATLAVSIYPFDPLPTVGAIFLTTFVLAGGSVMIVYAQIHRDATLSHVTNTRPGELGFDFWAKLFGFGIGPLAGLLTALFPSITDFVVSWLQPGAQAIR